MKLFRQIFWLIFLPAMFGLKIGVSKINNNASLTTTTTAASFTETISPNVESFSETEATTTTLKPTTAASESEFPPKITTKSTKKQTTPKPIISTTTPEPTTTLVVPTITTSNESTSLSPYDARAHFYCSCNLMPLNCDINCCCDPDCAKEALKVFNCFLPSKYPELRLRLEDFQYEHALPSCKINDGWLCVFRTNTKPATQKLTFYNFDTTNNFKWPRSLTEIVEVEQRINTDFYKFGDPILIMDKDTLEIQNFELPYAFKPPYCKLKEPIRHLMPIARRCLVSTLTKATDTERKHQLLLNKSKLLTRPKNSIIDADDLDEYLINFQITKSEEIPKNKIEDFNELNNFSNETENEDLQQQTYINEINIKITHNFTDLMSCLIEIKLKEIGVNETEEANEEIWQTFSVEFIAFNATTTKNQNSTKHFTYSGPLGYLQGEPIIIGKFIANNESEEISAQNRILDYFKQPLVKYNTLPIFSRRNGFCEHNSDKTLNFAISSLHQCSFQMSGSSLAASFKNKNATGLCLKLQQEILMQLFERNTFEELNELFVSTLGHPQNVTAKWLPLHIHNSDFAPIVGQLIVGSQSLVCRNMLLSAAYEFHIGTFTEQGIAHQAIVKNAALKLGQRHDLEFTMDEQLVVPLTLTVMFYDVALNSGIQITISQTAFAGLIAISLHSFKNNFNI